MANDKLLLDIRDLSIHYEVEDGTVRAVEGLNLRLGYGETLGFVGETGAGKTTLISHLIRNAGGRRLAVVVNEFGITEGLVTLSDLMGTVVGDVLSGAVESPMAMQRNDGSWLLDGLLPTDELRMICPSGVIATASIMATSGLPYCPCRAFWAT